MSRHKDPENVTGKRPNYTGDLPRRQLKNQREAGVTDSFRANWDSDEHVVSLPFSAFRSSDLALDPLTRSVRTEELIFSDSDACKAEQKNQAKSAG